MDSPKPKRSMEEAMEAASEVADKLPKSLHYCRPTPSEETMERVARAMIEPLGYPPSVDWERTWIGNIADNHETGSLAYLCRSLARAAIKALGEE